MKQLARKCRCNNVMIVSVGRGPIRPRHANPYALKGYQKVSCIRGCQLSLVSFETGRVVGPKVERGGVMTQVICNGCCGYRRLTGFQEIQV